MWLPISTAPLDHSLKLAVIDDSGTHALIFPCRRATIGWVNAATGQRVQVNPTHWQPWSNDQEDND
jgi:hypothetical protein